MTNPTAHSSLPLRRRKLPLWIAVLLTVLVTTFWPNVGASDPEATVAHAAGSGTSADSADRTGDVADEAADRTDRIEQVVDPGATGIRLVEVRFGPDRVAERRSDLDSVADTREFGFDAGTLRLTSESVTAGSDREGIPPLYHLHAALLI